jgi:hypothetical protein
MEIERSICVREEGAGHRGWVTVDRSGLVKIKMRSPSPCLFDIIKDDKKDVMLCR